MSDLTSVEVLVVGGGGAGGQDLAGGGGGGGVVYQASYTLQAGSPITVVVGGGGQRPTNSTNQGAGTTAQGGNSQFGNIVAYGGGAGAGSSSPNNAGNGGSGGGAGAARLLGTGTAGQGYDGARTASGMGGGGGGAGGPGNTSGAGGIGVQSSITGSAVYYGGGGGGTDSTNTAAAGGNGGGGTNGGFQAASNNGVDGLGGGGSAYYGSWGGAGNGGSGIVIVKYAVPQRAIGGNITIVSGNVFHTFTSVGSTEFIPGYSAPAITPAPGQATGDCEPIALSEYYGNDTIVRKGTVGFPDGIETVIPELSRISIKNFYGSRAGAYTVFSKSPTTGANLSTFVKGDSIRFDVTSIRNTENLFYTIEYLGSGITYEVIPSKTTVGEGELVDFTVRTTGIATGTTLYWCIKGVNVNAIDFAGNVPSSNTYEVQTTVTGSKEGITAQQIA